MNPIDTALTVDDEALAYELRIEAPPAIVWAFWTDPDRLTRWMGRSATFEPCTGGGFRIDYGSGDVASGEVLELDPPRRLVLAWGWEMAADEVPPGASRVEVTLEPVDGGEGTVVRLRHSGLPPASRAGHDEGWAMFLPRLVEAVAAR